MSSLSIRVDQPTHETLVQLSKERDEKMSALLAEAVRDLKRKLFMQALNAEYAQLRANPEEWAEVRRERELWDAALADGLEK